MKQNRMTHVKRENKPVSSLLSNRLLPIVAVGFVLGLITFLLIGLTATPDPYGCTQCDPFLPGYDGPPPMYIEPDFGDDGYYDDGYYDDPLGIMSPGFYGPGNNVECIFEECVPYGTGGW